MPVSAAIKPTDQAAEFIVRWSTSGASERSNYALFLSELCDVIGVPRPDPSRADDHDNAYVIDKVVTFSHPDGSHSKGWIDLYKRNCFVLEAKQGSDAAVDNQPTLFAATATTAPARRGTAVRGTAGWDAAMVRARAQADRYVHNLPAGDANPPFILIVDVGHVIEVFADFSRLGRTYTPFPDSQTHRIKLADLADELVSARLAAVWTDPLSLDPSRVSAKVTREVAADLALLAKSLEKSGHAAELVSQFLMRLLFTLFAEDVGLIGENRFTAELKDCRTHLEKFPTVMKFIWKDMDVGSEFSPYLRQKVLQFNGGLFEDAEALPVTVEQLELLIAAAEKDWKDVEPAIFGTLLERALDTRERHKLGAHFTPRAYVERLVLPTVIEPLREQWDAAKAAAFTLSFQGDNPAARKVVHGFLDELCKTRVLDPACGTGNFLYVTMEHMKRLEGEVRDVLRQLGETQDSIEGLGTTVDPHQFLGLEINPRARDIADVVLWIGYLKWHLRTLGHAPNPPILRKYDNIKCQDAVLAYDSKELLRDEGGKPVTRWDGHTTKKSPVTGEEVPDPSAQIPVWKFSNARQAEWPKADFIVGNPPFIGNKRMVAFLSEEYSSLIRKAYDQVPESADYVMYWWEKAASLTESGEVRRFGLITTNSITQSFNRRVLSRHLSSNISIVFAIPDHPWTEAEEGAAVRIAMTAVGSGKCAGTLQTVKSERELEDGEVAVTLDVAKSTINAALTTGPDVTCAIPLRANAEICGQGMKLVGDFFVEDGFTLGDPSPRTGLPTVRKMVAPGDVLYGTAPRSVIDFFELSREDAQQLNPTALQTVLDRVKPLRDQNRRDSIRKLWWRYAWERPVLRKAISGLERYFVTLETSKYRHFTAVDPSLLWDGSLFAIALDDFWFIGVLGSRFHYRWALDSGGMLGPTPRYNRSQSFEAFPFPSASEPQKAEVRRQAEKLDSHRKSRQLAHPGLSMTDMYNVLEKLRSNVGLTAADREMHRQGLLSVLKQIHDDLDVAVAEAYGWPVDLSDEEILRRLVALNAERAEEEKRGIIRWLRPEFQNPGGAATTQQPLGIGGIEAKPAKPAGRVKKPAWPKEMVGQVLAVRGALTGAARPMSPAEVAATFKGVKEPEVNELLVALEALGQARKADGGRFAA